MGGGGLKTPPHIAPPAPSAVQSNTESGMFMEDVSFLIEKVQGELRRYEHLLFDFWAEAGRAGVNLNIRLKWPEVYDGVYTLELQERDIMDTSFPWSFERLLFACIHDYAIEMFTRTPQSRV